MESVGEQEALEGEESGVMKMQYCCVKPSNLQKEENWEKGKLQYVAGNLNDSLF